MGKDKGPWQDARRAFERLNGWHQDSPSAAPGHPDDGVAALEALGDIGVVRRLLDQAEMATVRTARRHRKSWAEIATRLGVTRQSAWERWRELDESSAPMIDDEPAVHVLKAAAEEVTDALTADSGAIARAARESRRRATVVVPSVIGMAWDDAVRSLLERRLVGVGRDPDGPPLPLTVIASGVVTDQTPEVGANVLVGSSVTLWVERGDGSAGVREPRRPKPGPRTMRQEFPDSAEEAVG